MLYLPEKQQDEQHGRRGLAGDALSVWGGEGGSESHGEREGGGARPSGGVARSSGGATQAPVLFDEAIAACAKVNISGGDPTLGLELDPQDLLRVAGARLARISEPLREDS